MAEYKLSDLTAIPMPRPDPRGSVQSIGRPGQDWREIGPDGMEVTRGPAPPPQQPQQPNYTMSEDILAALRAMFEGERYREQMMHTRDRTGLYDKR